MFHSLCLREDRVFVCIGKIVDMSLLVARCHVYALGSSYSHRIAVKVIKLGTRGDES